MAWMAKATDEQEPGEPQAAIEDRDNRRQNCGGRQCARVKILVGELDGDSPRQRERQQAPRPMQPQPIVPRVVRSSGGRFASNRAEEKSWPRSARATTIHASGMWVSRTEAGDQFVEDGCLKLNAEEIGIVRKERRIQIALDRGEVERVVFQAGMVAHHQRRQQGEQRQAARRFGARNRLRGLDRFARESFAESSDIPAGTLARGLKPERTVSPRAGVISFALGFEFAALSLNRGRWIRPISLKRKLQRGRRAHRSHISRCGGN